jgi:phosphohistidine phosphatase
MATELLILRHAKSSWDSGAKSDFDRPLSSRGRRTAPRIGRWLADRDLVPDFAFVSPSMRTRQTFELLVEALGSEPDMLFDERIYDASLGELVSLLADRPEPAERVLLLGHNPGLEMLVDFLASGAIPEPSGGAMFPTAALAHLVLPDDWGDLQRGDGELLEILRPRDLDE